MKRIVMIIGVVAIATIALSSCRKCVTCKAYDRQTLQTVNTQEYCGFPKMVNDDVDFYEDLWNDTYTYAKCD